MTAMMARTTPIITGVSHAEVVSAEDGGVGDVVEVVAVGFRAIRLAAVVLAMLRTAEKAGEVAEVLVVIILVMLARTELMAGVVVAMSVVDGLAMLKRIESTAGVVVTALALLGMKLMAGITLVNWPF
jgi:hypothetical protein